MAQGRLTSLLTVREAVRIVEAGPVQRDTDVADLTVALATSFTPLHLETLLRAYVQTQLQDRAVHTRTAGYGDVVAALDELGSGTSEAAAVVVEWQDLDPRLGRRESVTAPVAPVDDVVASARSRLARLASALQRSGARRRTVVSLPTLPLVPAYAAPAGRVDGLRAELDLALAQFVQVCQAHPGVVVSHSGPGLEAAYDARGDVGAGHPYSREHASGIARGLAALCFPPPAKKGLITDLDDTLWRGLVGEVGADAVHWNLDDGSHLHAQYQQLLTALARRGILIAVASKNDAAVVERALARDDLLLRPEHYFPVVASWEPKSASVDHILRAWNIGAGDVVFVDDSSMELAEVERTHPGITTRLFPTSSAAGLAVLLDDLNELFWTEHATDEDALRLASIRNAALVDDVREGAASTDEFIASLDGTLELDVHDGWAQPRALDLVNKTNQFNLNGRRFTESEWREHCTRPDALNVTVGYTDRFGRLGTISVLTGQVRGAIVHVDTWVLSCRAFSRGIEQQLLAWLLQKHDAVELDHVTTAKNAPTAEFLSSAGADLTATPARVGADAVAETRPHPQITMERDDRD